MNIRTLLYFLVSRHCFPVPGLDDAAMTRLHSLKGSVSPDVQAGKIFFDTHVPWFLRSFWRAMSIDRVIWYSLPMISFAALLTWPNQRIRLWRRRIGNSGKPHCLAASSLLMLSFILTWAMYRSIRLSHPLCWSDNFWVSGQVSAPYIRTDLIHIS